MDTDPLDVPSLAVGVRLDRADHRPARGWPGAGMVARPGDSARPSAAGARCVAARHRGRTRRGIGHHAYQVDSGGHYG